MPASRSARAMTFAPRSWPSSPGLAMTTRILDMGFGLRVSGYKLDYRLFHVFAPDIPERVAHFADGGIRPDCFEQQRHGVSGGHRPFAQRVKGPLDAAVVAAAAQRLELGQLRLAGGFVDVEDADRLLVLLDEVVDADDDALAGLDGLLELVGAVGNLALRVPVLDRLDHPAHPI